MPLGKVWPPLIPKQWYIVFFDKNSFGIKSTLKSWYTIKQKNQAIKTEFDFSYENFRYVWNDFQDISKL